MSNPYTYCSRCGNELSDELKETYANKHERGPVLCRPCVDELFQRVPKAIQSIANALGETINEAFSPLAGVPNEDADQEHENDE